jgi:hypothetical protein
MENDICEVCGAVEGEPHCWQLHGGDAEKARELREFQQHSLAEFERTGGRL